MIFFLRSLLLVLGVCIVCIACNRNRTSQRVTGEIQVPVFTRIDTGALVSEVVRGRGLYPVDIDLDHDLDLFIGNSTGAYFESVGSGRNRPNLLYRNDGDCRFTKITTGILPQTLYETNPGNNWGDFDNDGDWDLFNHGELFINDGSGSIEQVVRISEKEEMCATWADYNSDSYLDLFTNVFLDGNYMYRNNGDGTFTEVSAGAATSEGVGGSQSSAWADCDNDGDLDVLEANFCFFGSCDSLLPCRLYINQGDGTFSSLDNGTSLVTDAMGAGGAAWGDYDNDGDMDVYVTSIIDSINVLYRNDGNLEFERIVVEPEEAAKKFTYNATWGDLNNDGTLDLFVAVVSTRDSALGHGLSFRENLLFMNWGDGTFARVTEGSIITDGAQATVANDMDNDGDLDLVITHGNLAPPFLTYIYRNEGNRNHWLNFTCEGTSSNRSGIGTRIRVKATIRGKAVWMTRELTQENGIHACNGARLHFGLGDAGKADSVVIRWPLGDVDTYVDIQADHFYRVIEDTSLEEMD